MSRGHVAWRGDVMITWGNVFSPVTCEDASDTWATCVQDDPRVARDTQRERKRNSDSCYIALVNWSLFYWLEYGWLVNSSLYDQWQGWTTWPNKWKLVSCQVQRQERCKVHHTASYTASYPPYRSASSVDPLRVFHLSPHQSVCISLYPGSHCQRVIISRRVRRRERERKKCSLLLNKWHHFYRALFTWLNCHSLYLVSLIMHML